MTSAEKIEHQVKNALEKANLLKWIVWDQSQFLNIGSKTYVELVLSDASHVSSVMQAFAALNPNLEPYEFLVRAVWKLRSIGEPELARTPDGNIVAATVVPVIVQSDRVQQDVNVLITLDAETSLTRILGRKPDLREVAKVVIGNALSRGGASSWNPQAKSRFEVSAQLAGELSRQLQRAA